MTLEDALELFNVMTRSEWEVSEMKWDWPLSFQYGVVSGTEGGVVALFTSERAACQYRLFLVNEYLNGKKEKQ